MTGRHQGGRKGPFGQPERHQGGRKGFTGQLARDREAGKDPSGSQGGTREAGKDQLDSLRSTSEAPEAGKNHLDCLRGTRETRSTGSPIEYRSTRRTDLFGMWGFRFRDTLVSTILLSNGALQPLGSIGKSGGNSSGARTQGNPLPAWPAEGGSSDPRPRSSDLSSRSAASSRCLCGRATRAFGCVAVGFSACRRSAASSASLPVAAASTRLRRCSGLRPSHVAHAEGALVRLPWRRRSWLLQRRDTHPIASVPYLRFRVWPQWYALWLHFGPRRLSLCCLHDEHPNA